MLQLTTEQIAKAIYKAEHESRRRAKRYLKEHGGTGKADELDAVIANPTLEVQQIVNGMVAVRDAAIVAAKADEVRMKPRHAAAKQLRVIAAALDGDWEQVATLCDHGDASCWDEDRRDAILAWGTSSDEMIAGRLSQADDEGEFDDVLAIDLDDAGDLEYVLNEIRGAVERCDRDIYEETAIEALRKQAVPNGRWHVMPYYRKTLSSDSNCEVLEFDDKEIAQAWLLVAHNPDDYRMSSYNVTLLDMAADATDRDGEDEDEDDQQPDCEYEYPTV